MRNEISSGSIEALKWVALISMTVDHINAFVFEYTSPHMYEFGRLAMPLFAFVLGYNLARDGAFERMMHWSAVEKLLYCGLLSIPSFAYLEHGRMPVLNIMFSLALSVLFIYFYRNIQESRSFWLAALSLLILSTYVDYTFYVIAICWSSYRYNKNPTEYNFIGLCLIIGLCALPNLNNCALLSIPLIALAPYMNAPIKRLKNLFYFYYPAHLSLISLYLIATKH